MELLWQRPLVSAAVSMVPISTVTPALTNIVGERKSQKEQNSSQNSNHGKMNLGHAINRGPTLDVLKKPCDTNTLF